MILTAPFEGPISLSKLHGMTLSSVTSLTVNPEPIIQFNLQIPSATSTELHQHKYLALHIMEPSEKAVELARIFSMGARHINSTNMDLTKVTTPFEQLAVDQWDLYGNTDKTPTALRSDFDASQLFREGNNNINLPILTKDAERVLICEKYKVFRVHNHEIWTCKVKDILVNIHEEGRSGGLLYFNRRFHKVGKPLKEPKS